MKYLLLLLPLLVQPAFAELPLISDAHIVQPPPGAPVAGGYLNINNTSDTELVLTGISSEDVGRVELHLSRIVDDVATMERQDELRVPASSTLELKHGSYHLMLMGLENTLQPGDEIEVIIESSAGPIPVLLPVVAPGTFTPGEQNDDGHSMEHKGQHDSADHSDHGGTH